MPGQNLRPSASCIVLLILFFPSQYLVAEGPQINAGGVINGASFDRDQPLAPGVIFSVFGTNLTNGGTASAVSTPLPVGLAGARVLVNGGPAPLFFASPLQINAQFPVELAGLTTASVQVEVEGLSGRFTSPPVSVAVAPVSPGIFSLNANGHGPGAILRNSDFSRICPARTHWSGCPPNLAKPGEVIAIYATGLGAVDGPWISGESATHPSPVRATNVSVSIASRWVPTLFAGLAPGFVGLYQINVQIPSDIRLAYEASVVVFTGESHSNSNVVTVDISPTGRPGDWPTAGGPPGTKVRALAIDPRDSTLYAGTENSGVWKSTDRGRNWAAANIGITTLDAHIQALAIAPSDPSHVYAASNEGGVFRSTNRGATWTPVINGIPDDDYLEVWALAVHPTNARVVYAGLFCGSSIGYQVMKSTDGGDHWVNSSTGLVDNDGANFLAIDSKNPQVLYALAGHGIFKSTNGGANWQATNAGFDSAPRVLALDPVNPSVLYATVQNRIFKSTDAAAKWAPLGTVLPWADEEIRSLVIDAVSADTLYVVSYHQRLFKSTDAGQTWTQLSGFPRGSYSEGPLVSDPVNPATLYAAIGKAGISRSSDGGASWDLVTGGMSGASINFLIVDPAAPATIYTAGGGWLFSSTDQGASWRARGGLASRGDIYTLVLSPTSPRTMYAVIGELSQPTIGLFKSTDGGSTWTALESFPITSLIFGAPKLAVDPLNPSIVYAATLWSTGGFLKSTDGGLSWTHLGAGLPTQAVFVRDIMVYPANPSVVYVSTTAGIEKSTDGGASWNSINVAGGAMAIDPTNAANMYVASGLMIFKSTDGGNSWSQAGSGLPSHDWINALVIDPTSPTTLYAAAMRCGVYKTTNAGGSWSPVNTGLAELELVVYGLAIDPTGVIYAATTGLEESRPNGIFKSVNGGQSWRPTGTALE